MSEEPLATYIVEHHKTHLIFDFDGTLAYAKFPWKEWGAEIADQLRDLDEELWQESDHHGTPNIQNKLVERYGDKALELLLDHSPEFEMRHKEHVIRNEELIQEVEHFRESHHMYMWTSNTRQLVEWVLDDNAMADWFEKIVTRNDVRFLKPYTEGFDLIRDPQVPLSDYLLIGDSDHDKSAALACGIDFFHTDFFGLGR